MALINGMYIVATSENVSDSFTKTNHPVEEGAPLSDHVERSPITVSVDGYAINTENLKGYQVYGTLRELARQGKQVRYVGRNIFSTGVITSMSHDDSNTVANGTKIAFTLEEMRIASSPYRGENKKETTDSGTKQTDSTGNKTTDSNAVYHTVKKGECLWGIARKYGTTLQWILDHNKVPSGNPNLIYPGEKYRVK